MENKKTPEQWFQMLREPYRSEAIANINKHYFDYKENPNSTDDALFYSFEWRNSPQGHTYWEEIHESLGRGETTYLAPETLTPEQMESGKWYVVQVLYKWLVKFDRYESNKGDFISGDIKSIRHATKEEVLKYFPDEVFEPKRNTDMVDSFSMIGVDFGMIKNDKQYQVTKSRLSDFEESLRAYETQEMDPLLKELHTGALESQIAQFQNELEEVNKRSQEKFKQTSKEFSQFDTLIEKFKDGKERYHTSSLVHQTITALLHNQDPILIIDQLISSQEELQKKLQEMIQSQPTSVILKEYILREAFQAGARRGYDQRSIMAGAKGLGEIDEDTYIQQLKSKSKL